MNNAVKSTTTLEFIATYLVPRLVLHEKPLSQKRQESILSYNVIRSKDEWLNKLKRIYIGGYVICLTFCSQDTFVTHSTKWSLL